MGAGLTVIVKVFVGPGQLTDGFPPVKIGVTVMVAVCIVPVLLTAVKNAMFPVPFAARPMEGLLFVHV